MIQPVLIFVVCGLAAGLSAQSPVVVDASGATGQFKTIQAAVNSVANGAVIHVKRGNYHENVVIRNKSVTIMGIEANAELVQIHGSGLWNAALHVTGHPAGELSRFSRMTVIGYQGTSYGFVVEYGSGDVVFDDVKSETGGRVSSHLGTVSLASCRIRTRGLFNMVVADVDEIFFHDCDLTVIRPGLGLGRLSPGVGLYVKDSTVTTSRCRIAGSDGLVQGTQGGQAMTLWNSDARISGRPSDTIAGGPGDRTRASSSGGVGITVNSSRLQYSGVTITGGLGTLRGQLTRAAAIDGPSTLVSPPMPVAGVRPGPMGGTSSIVRGRNTTLDVWAAPGAWSLTLISVEFRAPFVTPWGSGLYDLSKPAFFFPVAHDASGLGSFGLDLRGLPATFAGATTLMQTLAFDRNNQPSLSGPRLGVIGY